MCGDRLESARAGGLAGTAVKTGTVPEALSPATSPFALLRDDRLRALVLTAPAVALAALGLWALHRRSMPV